MVAALEVLAPGLHSTVQDFGRFGFQDLGVPVAGALDPVGLRLANALVGNRPGEAGLELSYLGPTVKVAAASARIAVAGPVRLALTPADGEARMLDPDRAHTLHQGDVLAIGAVAGAAVAYLAVAGGFDLAPVLGSLATYVRAGLGPLGGKPLAAGMVLPLRLDAAPTGPDLALAEPFEYGLGPIRVVPGPQADAFTDEAMATFLAADYTVSKEADRMGLRLDGPVLAHRGKADIVSDGLVSGCIQVPGNGAPIILLADHQTAGGYAKIATVISADLPRLGRAVPGTKLRFKAVSVAEAEQARRALEREVKRCIEGLRDAGIGAGIDLAALYGNDLVSGMIDAISGEGR